MVTVKYEGSLETLSFISDAINNVLNQLKDNDEILLSHEYTFDNNSIFIDLIDFIKIKDTINFRTAYSYLVNNITNSLFKYILENYKLAEALDSEKSTYQLSEGQDLYTYLSNSIKKEIAMTRNSENSEKIYKLAVNDNLITYEDDVEEVHKKDFIKGSVYPNKDFKRFERVQENNYIKEITSYLDIPKEHLNSNIDSLDENLLNIEQKLANNIQSINNIYSVTGPNDSNPEIRYSFEDILDSVLSTFNSKAQFDKTNTYISDKSIYKSSLTEFLRQKYKNTSKGRNSYSLEDVISIVTHFLLIKSDFIKNNHYYDLVCKNHSLKVSDIISKNDKYKDANDIFPRFNSMEDHTEKVAINEARNKLNNKLIEIASNYLSIKHKGKTNLKPNRLYYYKVMDSYFYISFTYLYEIYSTKIQQLNLSLIYKRIYSSPYNNLPFDNILNQIDSIIKSISVKETKDKNNYFNNSNPNQFFNNIKNNYIPYDINIENHSLLMLYNFSTFPNISSLIFKKNR